VIEPDVTNPHPHDHASHRQPGSYGRAPWWWDPVRTGGASGHDVDPSSMRVSNVERAEVTNALCRHFGDGRLDDAELEDRLARAAAAKTRADLAPLLADLPRLDPDVPVVTARRPRRHLAWVLVAVVVLVSFGWSIAGWAVGLLPVPFHVPWLLVALVVVVFLRRGRHHRRY
jgi:hypothetical protein